MTTATLLHPRPAVALLVGSLLFSMGWTPGVRAQEAERVFLEADSVATSLVEGRMVSELVNARFSQGSTQLRADRARDAGGDLFLFRGNVVIVQHADTVRADVIRYNQNTGIGQAEGNVVLTDGDVRLHSASALHETRTGRTFFTEPVRMEDSLSVLFADRGAYLQRDDRADFAGRVWLEREDVYIGADSISISREDDLASATGRVGVVLIDSTGVESARLFGNNLSRSGPTGRTAVSGRILIARFGAEPSDTLLVAAERARFGGERMTAVDSVVVATQAGALRSDSMVVTDAAPGKKGRERRFFGNVHAWYEDVQVTADSMFSTSFSEPSAKEPGSSGVPGRDSLNAFGSVFVARQAGGEGQDDSLSTERRIDQMKGRFLQAVVSGEELESLRLFPNAEVILYVRDDATGRLLAFDALSDTVFVALEHGEPTTVLFLGETAGTEYTENLFEQVRDLPGYLWVPQRRPDTQRLRDRLHSLSAERIDGRRRTDTVDSKRQD